MNQNAERYRRAVDGFSAVVDVVPAERWAAASPCEGWAARDVVGHVIGGMQRVAGDGPGGGPSPSQLPPGEDVVASYRDARDAAIAALTEDNLAKMVPGPVGEMPLGDMIGTFASMDVLVHTWDLARAAGVTVTLDEALVREAYTHLLPMDDMIRKAGVFGPKVQPPPGADPQTVLLCFTGRVV
jgi:uncharacterized protein (TIGR03086 family)